MDYDRLIERLRTDSLYADKASLEIMDLCMDAATTIETLRIENQALRNAANGFKAKLAAQDALIEKLEAENYRLRGMARKCIDCHH